MNTVAILALSEVVLAILIAALAIPLILRKIPMNHFYGARFCASFQSDENWYAINEYSGKALLLAAIPILLCGLCGLLFPIPENTYIWLDFSVTMLSILTASLASLRKAKSLQLPNLNIE